MATSDSQINLATGSEHTCFVNNGEARCWGRNGKFSDLSMKNKLAKNGTVVFRGQLGLGHTSSVMEPQEDPMDLGTNFTPKSACAGFRVSAVTLYSVKHLLNTQTE